MVVSELLVTWSNKKKEVLMFGVLTKRQFLGQVFLRDRGRVTLEFLWK